MCIHMNNSSISVVKIRFTTFAVDIDCICFEKGKEKTENFWSHLKNITVLDPSLP